MRPKIISIIGGTGKMGKLFKPALQKAGYKVILSGRNTKITPEQAAALGDVVIVTVPIRSTLDMIKRIGPHVRRDALFTDFTSVKTLPVRWMMKHSKAEVIGAHPVFGPTVRLKNQAYVLTPARGKKYISWYKAMLKKLGLNVIVTTPEEHDKRMAVVQCLTHLSNIAMADTIKSFGVGIDKTLEVSSPIYKIRLDMVGRVLNQDPALYSDIQLYNPFAKRIMKAYSRSIAKLAKAVEKGDAKAFEKVFIEGAAYLGDFCKKSQEESDYLIKKLGERR